MRKDLKATSHESGTIVAFNPNGEYYFLKGMKAHKHGDYHKAIKYLNRARQLEPDEPMIPLQLALVYTETGDYDESNRILFNILEELDSSLVECHYFIANNFAFEGYFQEAYKHASIYLEQDKDGKFAEDAEELLDLIELEYSDDFDEIFEQDEFIQMQEEAKEYLDNGQFQKAVNLFEKLIKEYPEYWSNYNNLSLAYFYLGEKEKAHLVLNELLEKNPGNLHALCNKLVFSHYQKDDETKEQLIELLKKIKPLSLEHQFKLGATLALVGEYEDAYFWLKRLVKIGFDGGGAFYYWLSISAYYTGRKQIAQKSWQKLVELNPEKHFTEPWNENKISPTESINPIIARSLASLNKTERIFGLFLASLSEEKDHFFNHFEAKSKLEEEYFDFLTKGKGNDFIAFGHEIAVQFYETIGLQEPEIYLFWFYLWGELTEEPLRKKNIKAIAAGIEYVWRKLRDEKCTQQMIAEKYGLSLSTVQKYIKLVKQHFS